MTHYQLVFNGPIHQVSGNALRARIAQVLELANCESLTLVFSSEGGSTVEGISLHNFIRALPVPIRIHGAGSIASIAVPIFCAGHRRTCGEFSRFFFHAFEWNFPAGSQMTDRIAEASIILDDDIRLSKDMVALRSKIPPVELDKIYGRNPTPTIVSPAKALEWGLVEEIVELNPTGIAQPNVAVWTVGW